MRGSDSRCSVEFFSVDFEFECYRGLPHCVDVDCCGDLLAEPELRCVIHYLLHSGHAREVLEQTQLAIQADFAGLNPP